LRGTASPGTGKVYPLTLLCEVLGVPRSTAYARHACEPRKRGPKTVLSDDALLVLIRDDLANSPFVGEGHRKVWARLRRNGIRVSKNRILAVMRAHHLLAPTHRVHVHGDRAHTGTIIAQEPNELWGTDATRLWTEGEGWCWLFLAVDHFNDEIVGWHVSERGDRFAAVEPVRQGVRRRFGEVGKDIARGLKLRMDHGSQYMARDFRTEVRFLGMEASPAFVSEPQGKRDRGAGDRPGEGAGDLGAPLPDAGGRREGDRRVHRTLQCRLAHRAAQVPLPDRGPSGREGIKLAECPGNRGQDKRLAQGLPGSCPQGSLRLLSGMRS
jgi:putative transposase